MPRHRGPHDVAVLALEIAIGKVTKTPNCVTAIQSLNHKTTTIDDHARAHGLTTTGAACIFPSLYRVAHPMLIRNHTASLYPPRDTGPILGVQERELAPM